MSNEMVGKSFSSIRADMGYPSRDEQFALGETVSEFRIELTNLFDLATRSEDPPQIREATWHLSPEQNVTIWFSMSSSGDWQAIHTLMWHPDDQF